MRKLLRAAATAALGLTVAQVASAADLAIKARPMPEPVFSWAGFYMGGHGGTGWSTTESSLNVGALVAGFGVPGLSLTLPMDSHSSNGFLAGGQLGYNWQANRLVFGFEGDISWADIHGNSACLVVLNCSTKVNWMADFTGRIGVVPMDRLLVYTKGGVAFANVDYSFGNSAALVVTGFSASGGINGTVRDTRVGALFGFGTEYEFMPNWSAKLEYDFMDFGKKDYNFPTTASGAVVVTNGPTFAGGVTFNSPVAVSQVIHTMRVGVNYKFW
jgi:outer membrane immunogenic protein